MRRAGLLFSLLVCGFGCGPTVGEGDLGLPRPDFSAGDLGGDLATPLDLTPLVCDLGSGDGGSEATLYAAGAGAGTALYAARFTVSGGWTPATMNGTIPITEVALAADPGGLPLLVARQADSTLSYAPFQPCLGAFAMVTPIPSASSLSRPAAVGGAAVDVVFRGAINNDQRYYHARWDGTSWSAPTTQSSFLSTLPPTAVRLGGAVHTIFTGTDSKIYDGTVADGAGGGTAAAVSSALSNFEPAAIVDGAGTLFVVFTGQDTNLYFTSRTASGSFAAPVQLCTGQPSGCLITSDKPPAIALASDGEPIVGFHGTNGQLYTTRFGGTSWTAAIAASSGDTSDFPPALATGVGSDDAELVYVRKTDGASEHARLVSGVWQAPATIPGASFTKPPALLTLP